MTATGTAPDASRARKNGGPAARRSVVVLVDNRRRDLMSAALIAYHLDTFGIDCHLEPLGAYRAVLAAYRPDMIVFNHLTADHLVAYSRRLARLGVLTAVLPNEGIVYDRDALNYNAGRYHRGAHIDHFFCWNGPHRTAILENGADARTQVEIVGVPRFDFYFPPWASLFAAEPSAARPRVLLCTNFVFARYRDLPRERADRLFAPWKERIPLFRDYWGAIETSHGSRARFLDFAAAIVAADRYDVTLRPHPGEDAQVYRTWLDALPAAARRWIRLDTDSNITGLILATDLAVSCETCTTALESWIARKPTVELVFSRHPMFFHPDIAALNPLCDRPEDLVDVVEAQLGAPAQSAFADGRQRHLARWCASPEGRSAEAIARSIAAAVSVKATSNWTGLDWHDHRRALRLQALRRVGLSYTYDPFLPIKHWFRQGWYAPRIARHRKAITPDDVVHARSLLRLAARR